MKARLLSILAGLLALGATAHATPRSHDLQATPIYRRAFYSSTSGTKVFATTNLRTNSALGCGTPDTIIVVTRPDGTEVMNDNCTSTSKTSCVSASGAAGSWLVTVFAQKESPMQNAPAALAIPAPVPMTTHCGIADVTVSGVLLDRDVTFGGAWIEPGLAGSFRVQSVHTPAGADDTVLLGYGATWQELGYDNDSGVGRAAAKTWTLTSGSKLVVGSFSAASSGRAALVLNDCTATPDASTPSACRDAGKDRDGDNLSNALETELGTDLDAQDTDRDGVFDYYEVIGRQLANGQEQELRRYGALPRRRDLFLELDREVNAEGDIATQFSFDDIDRKVEDPYLDLPRLPPAPDGSRIIAVHVDLGIPCPTRVTLCGDWGFSTPVANSFNEVKAQGYPQFSQVRRGLFQYGYVTTGGSGQAYGSTFYASYIGAATHESGHNLGLKHWGAQGQPRLNSKPNYPSLMNYAFQNSLPGVTPDRGRFSEGRLPAMDGLVDEATYDDGVDVRHLAPSSWSYPVVGGAIDFNRDKRFGGLVYADLAPQNRGTSGYDAWPHMVDAMDLNAGSQATGCVLQSGSCRPSGGSALAALGLGGQPVWITAFTPYLHQSGLTYPDVKGTVENGLASDWGPTWPGAPFDGDPAGEPAAVMFEDAGHPSALALFPHRDGRMHYRVVDMNRPDLGTWSPIPGLPAGTSVRNASLVLSGNEVFAVWRDFALGDDESNVYLARFDLSAKAWGPVERQTVTALATPGIARTPDASLYLAVPVTVNGTRIQLWRRRAAESVFSAPSQSLTAWNVPDGTPAVLRPRIALAFVPLHGDVSVADGRGQLHMWWTGFGSTLLEQDNWILYRAQLSGSISATATDVGVWITHRDSTGDRPQPGHSVAVAMRGADLIAMYSATDWGAVDGVLDGALRAPRYLPYAFGMAPGYAGLLDNDDAAVMDTQMCNALWQLPKGGNAAADCWCASGQACAASQESEEALCEPE